MKEIWLLSLEDNKFLAFTDEQKALEQKRIFEQKGEEDISFGVHYIDDDSAKEVFIVPLRDYCINPGECHVSVYDNVNEAREIIQYYLEDLKGEGVHFNSEGKVADISRDIACGEMVLTPEGDGSFIDVNVEAFKSLNVSIKKIPVID